MTTITGGLHEVTAGALEKAGLQPQDKAASSLALAYARTIDGNPDALGDLGPKLLAVLTALGMTPAGRGVKGGGQGATAVVNAIDELEQRRAKRAGAN